MTSISIAPAGAGATAAAASRNLALDRARTFLTLVVLLHHAVIPYTHFGHTDPTSWIGFDAMVLATDSFFMAMFFFLSGLFVWPSFRHKSPGQFVRDRLLRLGLPFAIAAVTVIPVGYYALELRQHPATGFGEFWWKMVSAGPWPSGPLWFVWVLLVFDLSASLLYRLSPNLLDPVNRLSLRGLDRPGEFFLFLVAVTAAAYVPARLYFGVNRWFELGPFSVQTSRVLLYAACFYIGAGVGAANPERGLLSPDARRARRGWYWAIATAVPYSLLWGLIFIKREILGNPVELPRWYEAAYGMLFVVFSAAMMFTILTFFLHFKRSGWSVLDPMQKDAYGIFLVHYAFALWIQYWLYDVDWPAVVKVVIGFAFTLAASWALTAALRRIPGATRVL